LKNLGQMQRGTTDMRGLSLAEFSRGTKGHFQHYKLEHKDAKCIVFFLRFPKLNFQISQKNFHISQKCNETFGDSIQD
jgi:hypothetical protein